MERRSFLQIAGAASVAGASLFASGSADAAAERHGVSFDRRLDAVADLGMDDSGRQAIDGALSSAAGDDTLIVFPPGTYRVNQQLTLKNVSNFGIVGASGDRSDVEFVTNSGNALQWIVAVGGRNHVYEDFTIQQTRDRKTSFSCVWKLPTGFFMENVELAGWNPRDDIYDTKPAIRPQITSRDGVGILKDFVCTGGGVVDTYPARRVPLWLGPAHRGELRLVDAHIEESGSHAIYGSRTNGCIRVEGGLFKNNDNTNMRIASGHPSKQSWVKGAEIVVDTDNAKHLPDGESYQQTRGIRCESGFQGWSGLLIEDCDIVFKSTPNSAGLITVHRTHGAVTVRNTRLRNEVDGVPFINAKSPNTGDVDSPYSLTLENVSITGAAANTHSAVRVDGRNGSVIENSCIERENSAGVKFLNSNNCAVRNTNINVPGQATIFQNSSVATTGVTHGDSCPLPSFDGVGGDDGNEADDGDGSDGSDGSDGTDGSDGNADRPDRVLTIHGQGDRAGYEFSVGGALEKSTDDGASINDDDVVDGDTATGAVWGGSDSYRFDGAVTAFSLDGDATVFVDGEQVDPASLGDEPDLPHTLTVDGSGNRADYSFAVSEALEAGDGIGAGDEIDGAAASGFVVGGADQYRFAGEVSDFSLDGDATVLVDGEEVDPAEWSDGDDGSALDRTIEVTGEGSVTNYEFSVSGDLAVSEDSLEPWDDLSGSTATGYVTRTSDVDAFSFDGEITEFRFHEGEATVSVDGEQVDPASLGEGGDGSDGGDGNDGDDTLPNSFVVDGTGDAGATEYELEVSGEIVGDDAAGALEDGDVVEGRSAHGSVSDDVDAFRFSGDLTKLLLRGSASIEFEDNDG